MHFGLPSGLAASSTTSSSNQPWMFTVHMGQPFLFTTSFVGRGPFQLLLLNEKRMEEVLKRDVVIGWWVGGGGERSTTSEGKAAILTNPNSPHHHRWQLGLIRSLTKKPFFLAGTKSRPRWEVKKSRMNMVCEVQVWFARPIRRIFTSQEGRLSSARPFQYRLHATRNKPGLSTIQNNESTRKWFRSWCDIQC